MLTLFQNITEELTKLEKETLVPMLIDTLFGTHGGNRFTGSSICKWFKSCEYDVSEVRLRKMINYIRVMNIKQGKYHNIGNRVVIGASNGYFITNNPDTVQKQIDSLQGRIDSMAAAIDTLKAQLLNLQKTKK